MNDNKQIGLPHDEVNINRQVEEGAEIYRTIASSITNKPEPYKFSLTDTMERGVKSFKAELKDDYYNSLLQIGSKDPSHAYDSYSLDNDTLNWTMWTILYGESWVFRRAIDKPAQDECNVGFILKDVADVEKARKIYNIYEEHKNDFIELLSWGALYGGSIAVMMFDGIPMSEMDKPIDFTKVNVNSKHILRMYITDRWYGCSPSYSDLVENFNNIDFGKPKYYRVNFADGRAYNIHHSYILRYEHRNAPKFIKNGQLTGWGYAEGAHIINEIMRDDKLKSTIQSLLDKSLIEVIHMPGMRGLFMGGDLNTNEQLKKRLESIQWARNFNSLTFLDKDDVYDMNTSAASTVGSLATILEQNMWLISAALEMPGVLYGHLNQGFSGDEGAEDRYSDTIYNRCNAYYKPVINKFLKILYRIFDIKSDVAFTFRRLNEKTDNQSKMEGIKNFESLLADMMRDGYLDKNSAADSLRDYILTGAININVSSEETRKNEAKKKLENEQNGNLGGAPGSGDGDTLGSGLEGLGSDFDFGADASGSGDMGGGMGSVKPEPSTPVPAPEPASNGGE